MININKHTNISSLQPTMTIKLLAALVWSVWCERWRRPNRPKTKGARTATKTQNPNHPRMPPTTPARTTRQLQVPRRRRLLYRSKIVIARGSLWSHLLQREDARHGTRRWNFCWRSLDLQSISATFGDFRISVTKTAEVS